MKNNNIKNINEFKKRIKMLYEYRMVDLNPGITQNNITVTEDENQSKEQQPQQAPAAATAEKPVQQTPQQPAPAPQPQPVENKEDNTELISFFKSEMSKLENVISAIDSISSQVEMLGQKMNRIGSNFDDLSKAIDEIREPSDIEKLEMRSFDSFPYNKTLNDVWEDKEKSKEEEELRKQGIRKTNDGYEMDYIPMGNMNLNKIDVNKQF